MSAIVALESTARVASAASEKIALRTGAELAVEQLDDLEHGDFGGVAGEGVAALHSALGAQHARPAQHGEELLEELHRDVAAAGELADRDRAASPAGRARSSARIA